MTNYAWTGGASGLWGVSGNWTPPGIPTLTDDEAFLPAGVTVTIAGGTYSVGVLQMAAGATLALTSGASLTLYPPGDFIDLTSLLGAITLDATSQLTFAQGWTTSQLGNVQVAAGGTLFFNGGLDNTGATLDVGAGAVLRGTINGGAINGAFAIGQYNLTLEGGPTIEQTGGGVVAISDVSGGRLTLENAETLSNVTLALGNATNFSFLTQGDNLGGDQVATLDATVTVNVAGYAQFTGSSLVDDALVNQGKIEVTGAGGYLSVSNPVFDNSGTIDVANGDTLTFLNNSHLTNTGTINVDATSFVTFQGLTAAQLGTLDAAAGATIDFAGTGLDNTGAVLSPVTGVNYEGEIVGGTIEGALTVGFSQTVTLSGGPILTTGFGSGPGFINDANAGGTLAFDGTQTLDNFTLLTGNTTVEVLKAGSVTTLGPNVTTTILGNTIFDGAAGAGLVNQGVINDNYNELNPVMYSIDFTNEGQMNFTDHEGFVVDTSVTFDNAASGTINVSAGANGGTYILFQDSIVNDGTISVSGVSLGQQAYVDYYYAVTGSGTTDISGGGLADFFQSMTQSATFTGAGRLQLNANVNTGTVFGFGAGDGIDLTALHWANTTNTWSLDAATNKLTVTEGGVSSVIQLDPNADYTGYAFKLADDLSGLPGGDGTLVTVVPCFCRGVRIATARGEVAVEDLVVGDLALTASGARRPVRWIGRRALDLTRHPAPERVQPVRIARDAFGPGRPSRDLWLSPDHALAFEGSLIPAGALVNGLSVQRRARAQVEYWHVELDAHDVILAEGLEVESYLDTGNRAGFENGGAFIEAHPDFAPRHWAATCLPLALQGPAVARARAALRARLIERGWELQRDAAPYLLADGARVAPTRLGDTRLAFLAPEGARALRLMSDAFVPAQVGDEAQDLRTLGLCVGRVQIDGVELALQGDLGPGWHDAEFEGGGFAHRWTDGAAQLPSGARLIVVDLAGQGWYWRAPAERLTARRR